MIDSELQKAITEIAVVTNRLKGVLPARLTSKVRAARVAPDVRPPIAPLGLLNRIRSLFGLRN